jgi:hypothetical protein
VDTPVYLRKAALSDVVHPLELADDLLRRRRGRRRRTRSARGVWVRWCRHVDGAGLPAGPVLSRCIPSVQLPAQMRIQSSSQVVAHGLVSAWRRESRAWSWVRCVAGGMLGEVPWQGWGCS